MKKNPNSIHGWKYHLVFKNLFVIAFLLFGLSASAQQRDPLTTYANQHAESPLAKLYLADPDNQEFAHAMKCAYILNSEQRDRYNANEIQIMEQKVSRMEKLAVEMNKLISTGMSHEMASKHTQEQMQKEAQYPAKPVQVTPASDPTRMNTASPVPSEKKHLSK